MNLAGSNSWSSDDRNPLRLACMKGDIVDLERYLLDSSEDINNTGDDGNTLLHLSAQTGSPDCVKLLLDRDARTDIVNNNRDTPLHLAALSGSPDCVKLLVDSGANLLAVNKDNLTPLTLVLDTIPDGEAFFLNIFDESVEITRLISGKEELKVNLKVLCPSAEANRMALVNKLYSEHRHMQKLLLHPLLKLFIYFEWEKNKHVIWYRFTTYLIYLLVLTVYISSPPHHILSTITRVMLGLLSVHVMLFSLAYMCPGQYSCVRKGVKSSIALLPSLLSLFTVFIQYSPQWCGISFLVSWLTLPFYTNAISVIGNQSGMFVYVVKEMCKHSLVLLFVLIGFSLSFFVLYYDENSRGFDNFWHAFLYTTLVLLQGDNMGDLNGNSTENSTSIPHLNYITHALFSLQFGSVMVSLLFVFVVIVTLFNMLVALAVRGGEELKNYGEVYHLSSQVQLLYEWGEVMAYFEDQDHGYEPLDDRDHDVDRNIPLKLRNELRRLVNLKYMRDREVS